MGFFPFLLFLSPFLPGNEILDEWLHFIHILKRVAITCTDQYHEL